MSVKSRELIEALESVDESMTEEVLDSVRERIGRTRTFSVGTAGDIMADCGISKATMNKVLDVLEFPAAASSGLDDEVHVVCERVEVLQYYIFCCFSLCARNHNVFTFLLSPVCFGQGLRLMYPLRL